MYKRIEMNDYRTVSKEFDMRMARTAGLPIWLRIYHAAGAEMNRSNHAHFGGSWENLASYITIEGEPMPTKAKVYAGVKKAVELGYLDSDSKVNCLVLPFEDSQKAAHSGYGCKYHDIKKPSDFVVENIDLETGEILDSIESPESLSNESTLPEYQINIPSPQTGTQTPSSPITEKVEMTSEEFYEWFKTASEAEQAVASFGVLYKKRDALDKVLMVAVESVKEEYDWTVDPSMKYAYAVMNITYEGPNKTKTETEECDW